jgi:hypothetical protein
MAAGVYNTTIEKGATFGLTITYKDASGNPVDLTGWTVRMQVRETPADSSPILTSEGGSPTIVMTKNSSGVITVSISAATTSLIEVPTAYYDIEAQETATSVVRRVLRGRIIVSPEVTR